jgi:hypothetical protein
MTQIDNKDLKTAKNVTLEDVEKGVNIFTKVWDTVKSIFSFFGKKNKSGEK